MADSRVESLAKVLVHYSIHVKKGDWVRIEGAAVAQELIRAAYIEVLKAGGNPMTRVGLPRIAYDFFTQAQDAEMSQSEYEDFVYRAGKLDQKDPVAEWQKVSQAQAKLVRFLNTRETIRIVGPDTDLSFNVTGRKWINCDGHENFPDGEVFTGPVENSAEGRIRYTFPAIHGGREVENVRLTFKQGRGVPPGDARFRRRVTLRRRTRVRHQLLHQAVHQEHAL